MYKLIAIDMDGTLLKEDKTITTKTKEVLKVASNLGVKIVLTSGRTIKDDDEILKIVLEEEKDVLDKITSQIPKELFEEYNVIRSVEFMKKGCNKATGIEKLAQHLGISNEEIIAIGDASNDKEMIEYAGLGVAMGNAEDEIKMLANFITKSNEEDGVAYVINKFIINDVEKPLVCR